MRIYHAAIFGLVGLLMARSAQAVVVYDTLTGQTETNRLLVLPQQNHAPMGDAFTATAPETITSVTVQLIENSPTTDSGSVLAYLVPSVSNAPSSSGVTLTNQIYLGSISDSLLTPGVYTNQTLNTSTSIAAGNYWLVLTSSRDPNNFYQTQNAVSSTAGWAEFTASSAVGAVGVPGSNFATVTNATNTGFANDVNGYVFVAQIQVPEPASLAVLGSGIVGIGISRHRRQRLASKSRNS